MDNLTHTLTGVLIGEVVARTSVSDPDGLPPSQRRSMLVVASAIGANLPDIDLLYSFLGGKVNYLLHHRGHSHTLVGAALLAALFFSIACVWLRARGWRPSRRDLLWLSAALSLMPLLHIAMDATNSYGVHPFWPLYNGWLYGDSIFIMEPLIWTACAPLVFLLKTLTARLLVALLLAAGAALAFFSGLLPPAVLTAFMAMLTGMLALGCWTQPRTALTAACCVWLGTTAMFIGAGRIAARQVDVLAATHFPQARLLDRVLTPMPANPLCWDILLVQNEQAGVVLRRAMLSLAPSRITAGKCLDRNLTEPATAPLVPLRIAGNERLQWHGEIITPHDRLIAAIGRHCEAAAAMRFIRAPWLATIEGQTVLGDLRYDRERKLGFAEIELHDAQRCPPLVPPWRPPRGDLLLDDSS